MSEEKTKRKQPKKEAPKNQARKWLKRLFIPGFGFVNSGEEASKEALLAWAKWTAGSKPKVDESKYLGT